MVQSVVVFAMSGGRSSVVDWHYQSVVKQTEGEGITMVVLVKTGLLWDQLAQQIRSGANSAALSGIQVV